MKHQTISDTGQRRFARLLWAIPLSILVHNLEEYPRIVAYARRHGVPIRRRPMGIAVALATVLPLPVTAAAVRRIPSRGWLQLALAIPALMAANGAMHLGQTIALRDYSPGTVTGVAINIPLAIGLYRRAARERWLAPGELRRAALLGAAAMAPLALLLQALGWLLDRVLPGRRRLD
jgi:hypothetical protein